MHLEHLLRRPILTYEKLCVQNTPRGNQKPTPGCGQTTFEKLWIYNLWKIMRCAQLKIVLRIVFFGLKPFDLWKIMRRHTLVLGTPDLIFWHNPGQKNIWQVRKKMLALRNAFLRNKLSQRPLSKTSLLKSLIKKHTQLLPKKKRPRLRRAYETLLGLAVPRNQVQNGISQLHTVNGQRNGIASWENLLCLLQIRISLMMNIITASLFATGTRHASKHRGHTSQMALLSAANHGCLHLARNSAVLSGRPAQGARSRHQSPLK